MASIKRPDTGRPGRDEVELVHRVMSFMLWPNNKSKRSEALPSLAEVRLAVHARKYRKKKHLVPGSTSKPLTDPMLIEKLKEAWFPELMLEHTQPASGYISVSVFLYFLIGLKQAHAKGLKIEVSDGKAAALTGYHVAQRNNGTKLILKSSKQIKTVWSKLKSVSHFWLAYLLMAGTKDRSDPVLNHFDQFIALSNQLMVPIQQATGETIDFKTIGKTPARNRARNFPLTPETLALLNYYKGDERNGQRIEFPKGHQLGPGISF